MQIGQRNDYRFVHFRRQTGYSYFVASHNRRAQALDKRDHRKNRAGDQSPASQYFCLFRIYGFVFISSTWEDRKFVVDGSAS